MRDGPFAGGSCSGLTYGSINNAQQLWVVNRGMGSFEIYDWNGAEQRWDIFAEVSPIDDSINESAGEFGVEQIQHPDPSWTPVPLEEE